MNNAAITRNCQWCEKPIRGRSDKKFCDDTCRNAFNNHRTVGEYNLVRNINHALVRNRRILCRLLADKEAVHRISREKLLQHGFQFKYCTHILRNQNGEPYYFCYEYGYHPLPHEMYLVIRQTNNS
ncbi:hypothetical protein [Flavihumibacter fluvii]|uniref:hypothetical protein n=1 Tax=Flavihumibacter fluvii TaxID=2838157 RepID=UPI001BDEC0AB|nr:hypothetical protein [Flavihumibacter fluvii]ULQ51808.1 hypothetical protein KJS93_17100 [Flavihumibacter fluvii]